MSMTFMLIAFLIAFVVALMIALVTVLTSSLDSRHRTRYQLLRDMFVSPYIPPYMKNADGYRSVRLGNLGLGAWLNAEIEYGKQVHRPRGSRIRHTKSHAHH